MTLIPKKITPDRIKDSIVQFNYTANLPYEILLGKFCDILTTKLDFVIPFKPANKDSKGLEFSKSSVNSRNVSDVTEWIVHNEIIKIQLRPYEIIFNCRDSYPGWSSYFEQIQEVLSTLNLFNHFIKFNSLGIKYISKYPDIDLVDKLIIDLDNKFSYKDDNTIYRKTLIHNEFKIFISVANNFKVATEDSSFVSLIDIGVNLEKLSFQDINSLLAKINEGHLLEKEIFFTLLRKSFIDEHNPIY